MRPSRLPSTKSHLSYRVFALDELAALLAPVAALLFRNPLLFERTDSGPILIYTGISFVFCTITFMMFRLANSLPAFFSFHDTMEIGKAALVAVSASAILTFTLTRLDEIPRSVPAVHFLFLVTGTIAVRLLRRSMASRRESTIRPAIRHKDEQNVLVVGANKLTWFYIRMLDTFGSGNRRIVAILDGDKRLHGRSMAGHVVIGSPEEADALIRDFAVHGIPVSAIVVCERDPKRALAITAKLESVCSARNVGLELLTDQLRLGNIDLEYALAVSEHVPASVAISRYFKAKRLIDIAVSGAVFLIFLPLFIAIATLILVESGSPVLFWQRRVGRAGRSIFVYKFRTLRKPVDRHGNHLSNEERRSQVGAFLRATRLDELPQFFNVLNGSMSLVGPRPLLPVDQPDGDTMRLLVAPGITGWAQIHGGSLISSEQKRVLDDFYVENASLRLDILILWRTFSTVLLGDAKTQRRLETALDRSGPGLPHSLPSEAKR